VQTKLVTKLAFEFTPLALFFVASAVWEPDFYRPTTVLVVTTALSLFFMWRLYKQLALMALISGVTGIIAGSITLISGQEKYVEMKPTVISLVFAAILLTGALTKKPLFRMMLGRTIHMTEEGWRILTWLWFFYFMFIVGFNEYVRTHYDFGDWAFFKVFVLMPLTILYALPQVHFLKKHRMPETHEDTDTHKDTEHVFARTERGAPARTNPVPARQP
jgi:intracellular septation protein